MIKMYSGVADCFNLDLVILQWNTQCFMKAFNSGIFLMRWAGYDKITCQSKVYVLRKSAASIKIFKEEGGRLGRLSNRAKSHGTVLGL